MKRSLTGGLSTLLLLLLLVELVAANSSCPAADQALWRESEFAIVEENLRVCGLKSLGETNAARQCLRPRSQLSDTCLECQVRLIVCTGDFCPLECANGGRSNARCVTCVETGSPCNAQFLTCTNFPFPKCNDCTQPGSDGFIPGTSSGASIGIVVGGGAGALILLALLIYLLCFRESKVSFKPQSQLSSQHSGGNLGSFKGSPHIGGLASGGSFHTNNNGSPNNYQVKLYSNSVADDNSGGAAYMFGEGSARPPRPQDPIMQDI